MNKYFIAGFVAGEGSFGIYKIKGKPNSYVVEFIVEVNKRDLKILKEIQKAVKCGYIYGGYKKRPNMVRFKVSGKKDLINKVIPFMDKYLMGSYKRKQYKKWRKRIKETWNKFST